MRTALVIIKRPVMILPPLAELCIECYDSLKVDWRCIIDEGEHTFHHKIKTDFLVRRLTEDLFQLAIDLAKAEGKCDRIIVANFGDRCDINYTNIKTNHVGISHLCDYEGNILEEKSFIQGQSFTCYSCTEKSTLGLDGSLNVFVSKIATPEDLDHYNLDCK